MNLFDANEVQPMPPDGQMDLFGFIPKGNVPEVKMRRIAQPMALSILSTAR